MFHRAPCPLLVCLVASLWLTGSPVLAQEVGRLAVPVQATEDFVETFRIEWSSDGGWLDLAWGDVLVRIPVEVGT